MQATERLFETNNWIAILFVFCLFVLFLLKLFSAEKMRGYSLSVFNKGFIEIMSQEKKSVLTLFDVGLTGFSFLSISLTLFFLFVYYRNEAIFSLIDYTKISSFVLLYMVGRNIVEALVMRLLAMKEVLTYFFLSKRSYLYSISIGLFFLNLCYFYGFQNISFLLSGIILLFLVRFALILINNKNLIIKEFFYFILYLCAFEIAPLLILFKLIF